MKNKKTLDTLVQDIYDKLDTLTEGKSLDVSEETATTFGESMKQPPENWPVEHPLKKQT